jgi:hypothetical protein
MWARPLARVWARLSAREWALRLVEVGEVVEVVGLGYDDAW